MPASKLERSCSGKGCPGRRKPSWSMKVIRADSSLPAGRVTCHVVSAAWEAAASLPRLQTPQSMQQYPDDNSKSSQQSGQALLEETTAAAR